jgi:hypothetical protein
MLCGSVPGRDLSIGACASLNIPVFAPIPSASVIAAVTVNAFAAANWRSAKRISLSTR